MCHLLLLSFQAWNTFTEIVHNLDFGIASNHYIIQKNKEKIEFRWKLETFNFCKRFCLLNTMELLELYYFYLEYDKCHQNFIN